MRGIKGLIYETSLLDAEEVCHYELFFESLTPAQGYSFPQSDDSRVSKEVASCRQEQAAFARSSFLVAVHRRNSDQGASEGSIGRVEPPQRGSEFC